MPVALGKSQLRSLFFPAWLSCSLLMTACTITDDRDVVTRLLPAQVPVAQVAPSPEVDGVPALQIVDGVIANTGPDPLVDLDRITSGGLPPDGLPSIDQPRFVRARSVWFLSDREPVLSLEINGDARAYPVQIMMWHEIVNDVVGGVPVTVTYCPLCNSAVAYERVLDDRTLEFGTSGRLLNSSLVMYDRQTGSLWSHFTGQAIVGDLVGERLPVSPLATVAWDDWRSAHPNGLVLDRETGFIKEYGLNPYPGYDDVDATPFLFEGSVNGQFTAMTRMVAFIVGEQGFAIPLDRLRREPLLQPVVGDRRVVVWWKPGVSSALDSFDVAAGRDVGATFVGSAEADDVFVLQDGVVKDRATGSTWDIFGRAVAGSRQGEVIERLPHFDTFWFAWSAFRPNTTVWSDSVDDVNTDGE